MTLARAFLMELDAALLSLAVPRALDYAEGGFYTPSEDERAALNAILTQRRRQLLHCRHGAVRALELGLVECEVCGLMLTQELWEEIAGRKIDRALAKP